MSEWQPIETAPKDGTEVLLAVGGIVDTGNWQAESPVGLESGVIVDPVLPEGWYGLRGLCPWDGVQPTHWMPLPEPPQAVNAGATPSAQGVTESAHNSSSRPVIVSGDTA
jgi:hypothetical protein